MTSIGSTSGTTSFTADEFLFKTNKINVAAPYDAIVDYTGNSDYSTLEAALNNGETNIFIRNGTYTPASNSITPNNYPDNLKIVGESRDGAIINMTGHELHNAEELCK